MQVTQLTVSYSRTQSLPTYSNIKPGVTITANLEPDEDWIECHDILMDDAHRLVHGEIDAALEDAGQSPIFTHEPLFYFARNEARKVIVIVPAHLDSSQFNDVNRADPNWDSYRYTASFGGTSKSPARLLRVMRDAYEKANIWGFEVIQCLDGDLSRIPPLPTPPDPEPTDEPEYIAQDYSDLPNFDEEE